MPSPLTDSADALAQSVVVDVLAPVAVDTAYSYRAPSGLKLEPGAFVRMPLGRGTPAQAIPVPAS